MHVWTCSEPGLRFRRLIDLEVSVAGVFAAASGFIGALVPHWLGTEPSVAASRRAAPTVLLVGAAATLDRRRAPTGCVGACRRDFTSQANPRTLTPPVRSAPERPNLVSMLPPLASPPTAPSSRVGFAASASRADAANPTRHAEL